MREKSLASSMLVPHVLLKIKGWKGMIGNPIDQGKYTKLKLELICLITMEFQQLSMQQTSLHSMLRTTSRRVFSNQGSLLQECLIKNKRTQQPSSYKSKYRNLGGPNPTQLSKSGATSQGPLRLVLQHLFSQILLVLMPLISQS